MTEDYLSPGPNGGPHDHIRTDTVKQAIQQMSSSLTVVYAEAQLLQRRSRDGAVPTPAQVARSVDAIAHAAVTMMHDLRTLEDACDHQ